MFLTSEDLIELTGYRCPAKQISWLSRNGFKCVVNSTGHPKVLISHLQEIMMNNNKNTTRRNEPDFEALHVTA